MSPLLPAPPERAGPVCPGLAPGSPEELCCTPRSMGVQWVFLGFCRGSAAFHCILSFAAGLCCFTLEWGFGGCTGDCLQLFKENWEFPLQDCLGWLPACWRATHLSPDFVACFGQSCDSEISVGRISQTEIRVLCTASHMNSASCATRRCSPCRTCTVQPVWKHALNLPGVSCSDRSGALLENLG